MKASYYRQDSLIAGVVDTGGNLTTPVANLPPVLLIPVVNLERRISPRIFEKIRNGPNGILRGPGDTDLWKKLEVEKLVSDSL